MANSQHKFFEIIRPDHNFEFVGLQRYFIGTSIFLIALTLLMLPLNRWVLPHRGQILNWSIEFRGGTEMTVEFSGPQDTAKIREALDKGGFSDSEVVKLTGADQPNGYILRFGAISAVTEAQSKAVEQALADKVGADASGVSNLRKFEFSEGGDKIFLRFNSPVDADTIGAVLKGQNVGYTGINKYGRDEDHTFEVVLLSVNQKTKESLEQTLGAGAVSQILSSDSVGAKAGAELRDDGVKSLLAAILFIMIYIAIRFDFRYGPGTVVALLHDAFIVMGAFAVVYEKFSLTTVAAILTVIGYSMNDTIVVFDRIRENAARLRDKRFDRVVNASINETLSRTILTSATVFFVTLAMNIWGTGTIREFAFAMNVGVIVGTYSSIFIASPILIWLNERFYKQPVKASRGTA
jgi:preprotein translocase subunit SecF